MSMHRRLFLIIFLILISLSSIFGFGASEENNVRDNANKITINTFGDISISLSDQDNNFITLSNNESYAYIPEHEYNINCVSNNKSLLIKNIEITHTGNYDSTIKTINVNSLQYSGAITLPETENGITIIITTKAEGVNLKLYNNIGASWVYGDRQFANNEYINIIPSSSKQLTLKYDPQKYYLRPSSLQHDISYDNDTYNGKITVYTKNITRDSVIEFDFASYIYVESGNSDLSFYKDSNLIEKISQDTQLKSNDKIYASINSKEYFLKPNIDCTITEQLLSSGNGREYEITFNSTAEGRIRFEIAKGAKISFENKTDGICDSILKINNQQYTGNKNETYPMGSLYQLTINCSVPIRNNQAICVTVNNSSNYYTYSGEEILINGIINTSAFSVCIDITDDIYLVEYPPTKNGGGFTIMTPDYDIILPDYTESAKFYDIFSDKGKLLLVAFPSAGYYTDWSYFTGKENDFRLGASYEEITVKEYTESLNRLPEFSKFSEFKLPSSNSQFCYFTFEFDGKTYYPGDTIYFAPGEKIKVTGRLQGDYSFGLIAGRKKTKTYELPISINTITDDFRYK